MSKIRIKIAQIGLIILVVMASNLARADSGYYRKISSNEEYYGSIMYIISNGRGQYYQYIDGKYYPMLTRPYYDKRNRFKIPQRYQGNIYEKWEYRGKKNASSSDYPIYFDE